MMRVHPPQARRRQRGIAAMELALLMPVLLMLLTFPLFFGRLLWHYSVINRAAQDAARYLSTVPLSDIRNANRAPAVTAVAKAIVDAELGELAPGPDTIGVTVGCDYLQCLGFTTPANVNVGVQMELTDIFFWDSTYLSLPLTVNIVIPYLGK